jgi:hypothetical protein
VKGTSSKKGESSATPSDVGASLNKMFHQCPWTLCTIRAALDAAERKLVPTTDRLKFIGRNRSWFVHVDLGGYGIDPCFAPPDWQPTREQRMFAAMMHSMSWLTSYSKSKLSPRMVKFIHKLVPTYLRRYSGPPTSAGDYPGGLSLSNSKIMSGSHAYSSCVRRPLPRTRVILLLLCSRPMQKTIDCILCP